LLPSKILQLHTVGSSVTTRDARWDTETSLLALLVLPVETIHHEGTNGPQFEVNHVLWFPLQRELSMSNCADVKLTQAADSV